MFSPGRTYSAKAEQQNSTRQATRQPQQARQVYAYPAYLPCGFPLAQGQHRALARVFIPYLSDLQLFRQYARLGVNSLSQQQTAGT